MLADKEKIYNRQVSAPILKRKTSRFGLGQFLTSSSSSGNNPSTNNNPVVATSLHAPHCHYYHQKFTPASPNPSNFQMSPNASSQPSNTSKNQQHRSCKNLFSYPPTSADNQPYSSSSIHPNAQHHNILYNAQHQINSPLIKHQTPACECGGASSNNSGKASIKQEGRFLIVLVLNRNFWSDAM